MHPILAIVGRANVGKSRLFNRIVGRTSAIVADIPGITRDRHFAPADWAGREFIVVDTGGIDLDPALDLEQKITKQSLKAIEESDVVVCLFDGQNEPTSTDRDIVEKLRAISKPVVFAINKIDELRHEDRVNDFRALGVEKIIAVSAEHGRNVDDLLTEAVSLFPSKKAARKRAGKNRFITVVGRPNVGKSTLVNRMAGEERVVVHETPGTTRDAIDVEIAFEGKSYTFIDTAGVKKAWAVEERVEKFTAMRSLRTIDRADIVLLLIDGAEGLTKQDLTLAGFIHGEGKGLVLLVNKWDLVKLKWEEYAKRLQKGMGELHDVRAFPISAATGLNCLKIFGAIDRIDSVLGKKIPTSKLNSLIEKALAEHHMPVYKGKQVRIYYARQMGTYPPSFALFSNYPAAVPYTYRRYLTGCLKKAFSLHGVPLKLVCRKK